jgi:hypothetical protein
VGSSPTTGTKEGANLRLLLPCFLQPLHASQAHFALFFIDNTFLWLYTVSWWDMKNSINSIPRILLEFLH